MKKGFLKTVVSLAFAASVTNLANAQFGNGSATITTKKMTSVSSSSGAILNRGPERGRLPLVDSQRTSVSSFANKAPESLNIGKPGNSNQTPFERSAFGSHPDGMPYTTARVAIVGPVVANTPLAAQVPVMSRPYRFTGKLRMRFGSAWFVCSASLVRKGVVLTAAHCVHNYGQGTSGFADEVQFIPANWNAVGGRWGAFTASQINVPTPYVNGTDTCLAGAIGIVCNNDLATVTLNPRGANFAGNIVVGFNSVGWNLFGFTQSSIFGNNMVGAIHQLGYPVAFDGGFQMQRSTSLAYFSEQTGANGRPLRTVIMGSAQTGGSSGGPWIVNFGARPTVSSGASLGSQSTPNVIKAVTSFGFTTVGVNVQGASYFGQNAEFPLADYGGFGAGNIGSLMQTTCTQQPGFC